MSGMRARGQPAYANYSPQTCPVCGKDFKNFDRHTETKDDEGHKRLRCLHAKHYLLRIKEVPGRWVLDSGVRGSADMKAWRDAIQEYGV